MKYFFVLLLSLNCFADKKLVCSYVKSNESYISAIRCENDEVICYIVANSVSCIPKVKK